MRGMCIAVKKQPEERFKQVRRVPASHARPSVTVIALIGLGNDRGGIDDLQWTHLVKAANQRTMSSNVGWISHKMWHGDGAVGGRKSGETEKGMSKSSHRAVTPKLPCTTTTTTTTTTHPPSPGRIFFSAAACAIS